MEQLVSINPHHPDCRYPVGSHRMGESGELGRDPARCCYCAAMIRKDFADRGLSLGLLAARPGEDPLDYRYGGPGCGCKQRGAPRALVAQKDS